MFSKKLITLLAVLVTALGPAAAAANANPALSSATAPSLTQIVKNAVNAIFGSGQTSGSAKGGEGTDVDQDADSDTDTDVDHDSDGDKRP